MDGKFNYIDSFIICFIQNISSQLVTGNFCLRFSLSLSASYLFCRSLVTTALYIFFGLRHADKVSNLLLTNLEIVWKFCQDFSDNNFVRNTIGMSVKLFFCATVKCFQKIFFLVVSVETLVLIIRSGFVYCELIIYVQK